MNWPEIDRELGTVIGEQLRMEALRLYDAATSGEWRDNQDLRTAAKVLSADLGYLALRHSQGVDVAAEVAQCRAQAASWAFVAAAGVRAGLVAAVEHVAKRCGEILGKALIAVVLGALG